MNTNSRSTSLLLGLISPRLALLGLLLGGTLAEVRGEAITVPNFSFESAAQADGQGYAEYWTEGPTSDIPGWTANGTSAIVGLQNYQNAQFPGSSGAGSLPGTADGLQAGFIYLGGLGGGNFQSDAVLTTILANTKYTLTLALGARPDYPAGENQVSFNFFANGLGIAGTQIDIDSELVPVGTFADYMTSFTTGESGPLIGQSLTIFVGFGVAPGGAADVTMQVDNVRLDATAVPEPATATLLLSSAGLLLFRRRRA